MPKRSHAVLQNWYKAFARELYEKANIDVTRIEDIGRVKNYYFSEWNSDDPLQPYGEYQYAFIPHNQMTYDNPPPNIENADAYMDWVMDNLQIPTNDDQIEKLMELSMAGTLMVFTPNLDGRRQVYTDKSGKITTSPILEEMDATGRENIPDNMKLPLPPSRIEPADPSEHGLFDYPPKPVRPANMNPSVWSMIGHKIFRMDNDYAKKERYERESATYDARFKKWFDSLDDSKANVKAYKADHAARQEYLRQMEEYKQKPLGIALAILNGYRAQQKDRFDRGEEEMGDDGLYPTMRLARKEEEILKKQHAELPQGKTLGKINRIDDYLKWEKRCKSAMTDLLGHQAMPNDLTEYLKRGVFARGSYKPERYSVPIMPSEGHTEEERLAFDDMVKDVAQVASFAALSHPDITGANLREGFNKEESAQLNYTMLLQNVMTGARPGSNEYMAYLEPARQKGRAAMEAYAKGEVKPLADLLRTSIRQTTREANGLANFNSDHSLNTLYYIGRMYKLMENDSKLRDAVGLTPEEMAETKGYVAVHKTMTKALQAKKLLLEHSLYMRELTPAQMHEAATDIRFASSIAKDIAYSHMEQTKVLESLPRYQEGAQEIQECSKAAIKEKEIAKAIKDGNQDLAAKLQSELARFPNRLMRAQNQMYLVEMERKPCENIKNLANENWIKDAKAALSKNCNIDRITSIKREDLTDLISHDSFTAFDKLFKPESASVREKEIPAPVREKQGLVMGG